MENSSSTDVLIDESTTTHEKTPKSKSSNRKLIGLGAGLLTTAILAFGGVLSETVAQVLEILIGSFMLGNSVEHIAKKPSTKK